MLVDYFKQYLKQSRGVSDSTVGHYVTGINTINKFLVKYNYNITNIFSVKTQTELDEIQDFLFENEEFIEMNNKGNRMYSSALKNFYQFACEDINFFEKDINRMDIKIKKPKIITSTHSVWERNQIIITQAIAGADYKCENDFKHKTFTSKTTGENYMEGHHLIPLKFQNEFDCSLDVYANIISLCPNCHKLLHFGVENEKEYVLDKLFDERKDRLIKSGIDVSRREFLDLVK